MYIQTFVSGIIGITSKNSQGGSGGINPIASEFGETSKLRLMLCGYYSFFWNLLGSCFMAETMLEDGDTVMHKTRIQPPVRRLQFNGDKSRIIVIIMS